jgi:hypothetical protein
VANNDDGASSSSQLTKKTLGPFQGTQPHVLKQSQQPPSATKDSLQSQDAIELASKPIPGKQTAARVKRRSSLLGQTLRPELGNGMARALTCWRSVLRARRADVTLVCQCRRVILEKDRRPSATCQQLGVASLGLRKEEG